MTVFRTRALVLVVIVACMLLGAVSSAVAALSGEPGCGVGF